MRALFPPVSHRYWCRTSDRPASSGRPRRRSGGVDVLQARFATQPTRGSSSDQVAAPSRLRSGGVRPMSSTRWRSAVPYSRGAPGVGRSTRPARPSAWKRRHQTVAVVSQEPAWRPAAANAAPSRTASTTTVRWWSRCRYPGAAARRRSSRTSSLVGFGSSILVARPSAPLGQVCRMAYSFVPGPTSPRRQLAAPAGVASSTLIQPGWRASNCLYASIASVMRSYCVRILLGSTAPDWTRSMRSGT